MKIKLISSADAIVVYSLSIFLLVICIATGFRSLVVGIDTQVYFSVYQNALEGTDIAQDFEFLYRLFLGVFASLQFGVEIFFTFLSFISIAFLFFTFCSLNRYFGKPAYDSSQLIFGFLFLFYSVFFYAAQLNVVRQGISCFAVFFFYCCILNRSFSWLFFISAIFSVGFHSTGYLYILVPLGLLFPYRSVFFLVAALCVFYSLGWSEELVKYFSQIFNIDIYQIIMAYGFGHEYRSGARLDFAAFSVGLGLLLDLLGRVGGARISSWRDRYFSVVKFYWLLLVPFFLVGFGNYSDRLLLNAWLFFSIVMSVFFSNYIFRAAEVVFGTFILLVLGGGAYILSTQNML